MVAPKPLDSHQRELVNLVKAAHQTLGLARETKGTEYERRVREVKIEAARALEEAQYRIRDDLERELAVHASNLDEALIAAYEEGVPLRRIALEGFGNQFDGAVQQKITKLRNDGRVGSRKGYHRNTRDSVNAIVSFPQPIDVQSVLEEAMEVALPVFEPIGRYVLFEATEKSEEMAVDRAVRVVMDKRDPFFRNIEPRASFSADRESTEVILYDNPFNLGELRAPGLSLDPEQRWMNRVAYWVALHPEEARAGFDAAVASVK